VTDDCGTSAKTKVTTPGYIRTVPENQFVHFSAMLERSGFAAFLAAFAPHEANPAEWARHVGCLEGELRLLVEFLLLGRPVRESGLPAEVRAVLPDLDAHQVLVRDGSDACLVGVALFRPFGVWLFAEPPGPFPSRYYFGADSLALAGHATVRPGTTVVDLCSGPGFQGLLAARGARHVDLVEIDPASARVAQLNALVNDVTGRVGVHCGDLWGPLGPNAIYDHVIANIPFVPGSNGGSDGFEVGRAVLAGLPERLRPAGTAHLTALLLRDGDGLLMHDDLTTWAADAGCGVTVALVNHVAVDADSELVQSTAADLHEWDHDEAAARVAAIYADRGATAASLAFLTVHAGTSPAVRILDLGRDNPRPSTPWI
jgi:predicted RNA methylase